MTDLHLEETTGEPNPQDKETLVKGLLAYHANQGHPRHTEVFSIFLKDQNDKVLGGVIVSFLWNGMHIDSLWVDESIRQQGWGQKLMAKVEAEAIKRGCTIAYTDTFTWQAPGFYAKLGYQPYGKLSDFPEGNALFYFAKKLIKQ